mmetsp:Transcript_14197/g.27601  ORF Transcript_14197/g.27601 Transcript_14197/m.27601 type:complete len:107 (-) Transcript_14197:793-1113(-)
MQVTRSCASQLAVVDVSAAITAASGGGGGRVEMSEWATHEGIGERSSVLLSDSGRGSSTRSWVQWSTEERASDSKGRPTNYDLHHKPAAQKDFAPASVPTVTTVSG